MNDVPRFAACSFQRVFDTTPLQDALTLPELAEALGRFLVKPKLQARIDKTVAEIDRAASAWNEGVEGSGRTFNRLAQAARDAEAAGESPAAAVQSRAEALVRDARRKAKKDLRLWAPLLFRAGGRRDTEDIEHVSCLVLDYDDGTPIEQAHEVWSPWFHLIHTTWSHTDAFHKFRVVLPLAQPVAPLDFRAVFAWAEQRTGFAVDPTGRGVARAYAIPAIGAVDAPRRALTNPGPLLNPALEKIVAGASPVQLPPDAQLARCLLRRDPAALYVDVGTEAVVDGEFDEDDPALWEGGALPTPSLAAPPRAEPSAPAAAPRDGLQARLDEVVARLESLGRSALVDGLERLALLHEQGAIDADEFRLAKRRLLED